jgi:hypothetical protein
MLDAVEGARTPIGSVGTGSFMYAELPRAPPADLANMTNNDRGVVEGL